jgi:hypothetical protein
MPTQSPQLPSSEQLQQLLLHFVDRLEIIGDQELRQRDPAQQLLRLQEVSESISAWHVTHRHEIPAKLNHYLGNASFQKAQAYIEEMLTVESNQNG